MLEHSKTYYRVRIALPIGYYKKGVWYEERDFEEFDCVRFKDGCYWVNDLMKIPKEHCTFKCRYKVVYKDFVK